MNSFFCNLSYKALYREQSRSPPQPPPSFMPPLRYLVYTFEPQQLTDLKLFHIPFHISPSFLDKIEYKVIQSEDEAISKFGYHEFVVIIKKGGIFFDVLSRRGKRRFGISSLAHWYNVFEQGKYEFNYLINMVWWYRLTCIQSNGPLLPIDESGTYGDFLPLSVFYVKDANDLRGLMPECEKYINPGYIELHRSYFRMGCLNDMKTSNGLGYEDLDEAISLVDSVLSEDTVHDNTLCTF